MKRATAKRKSQLLAFAEFVYQQLGRGPRTNGIDRTFCAEIGRKAAAALRVPHVCFTAATGSLESCDDPKCPWRKGGK